MKKEFIKKVIREGIVDTEKYRYVCNEFSQYTEIRRCPIELLDTTEVYTSWETVYTNTR